ncbi:nuclear transport factor 2 family protein [Geothrix sp. PMB-07]|uniref:nuclear transport factor 2 family protein n=1 Tax=Geothrix sp. PMB-07 TaxID=3068640 RepID=UPI002742502C|nr:nuclear transport factor 2 family protein [Geothrix sp. PMB-07]WLT30714.1 nuclear transport factor 2 family protein [Geothrix sp. PMB-07]
MENPLRDAQIVRAFLDATMVPDPVAASAFLAPGASITFTGGRAFEHAADIASFNAQRYRWVKKRQTRTDVAPGQDTTVVYNTGTLYGEWPDGTPFEGNRYIDRFEVRDGLIISMEVWNDSAERLLTLHRIQACSAASGKGF